MASPVHSLDHIGFVNAQRSQPQTDRIGHPCLFHDRFRQSELVFTRALGNNHDQPPHALERFFYFRNRQHERRQAGCETSGCSTPGVWVIKTAQTIPDSELWLHQPAADLEALEQHLGRDPAEGQ